MTDAHAVESQQEAIRQTKNHIGETLHSLAEKVGDVAQQQADKVGDVAYKKAERIGAVAQQKAEKISGQTQEVKDRIATKVAGATDNGSGKLPRPQAMPIQSAPFRVAVVALVVSVAVTVIMKLLRKES